MVVQDELDGIWEQDELNEIVPLPIKGPTLATDYQKLPMLESFMPRLHLAVLTTRNETW